MPPKPAGKAAAKCVNLAKEMHVDVDLKKVIDHIKKVAETAAAAQQPAVPAASSPKPGGIPAPPSPAALINVTPFFPFRKALEVELQFIKDDDHTESPVIPLLVCDPVNYETLKAVMGGLSSYPWLRHISLLHCRIGDHGAMVLSDFVRQYTPPSDKNLFGIETLELPENDIGPKGAGFLGRLLTQYECLKTLNLDFNPIGDEGAGHLGEGLKWNSTLTSLSMQYCGVGPEGGELIAKHVIRGSSVKELSLRGNCLGPHGITQIGRSLAKNAYLVSLDLADTSFGIDLEAIEALRDGIEGNDTLESVDLNHNSMVPAGVQLLLDCLKTKPKMTKFVVHDRISQAVFKDVLDTITSNIKSMKKKKKRAPPKPGAVAPPPAAAVAPPAAAVPAAPPAS